MHPTERHAAVLRELPTWPSWRSSTAPSCMYSSDADFSRFSGLRWVDPLRG